jgi:Ca2+-binding EF-hand superfamily protein
MRTPFVVLCLFMGSLTLLPAPTPSLAQFPPGSSRNQAPLNIDDIGIGQEEMKEWAQRQGITDGKLTPEQLRAYTQSPEAARARRRMREGKPDPQPAKPPSPPPKTDTPAKNDSAGGILANVAWRKWAENLFYELDHNADGFLSYEEMPDNFEQEWRKWDANLDGVIDLEEWCNYLAALTEQRRKERKAPPPRVRPDKVQRPEQLVGPRGILTQKRLVDRSGKPVTLVRGELPQGFSGYIIPLWFRECDTDRDGQVALHEWVTHGGDLQEFREMDLDGDGYITLDEVIRAGKATPVPQNGNPKPKPKPKSTASGAIPDPGNMVQFRGHIGKTFLIEVTGRHGGGVWGTDVYTDDSAIATAAVHAGVITVGEKAVIQVTVLAPPPQHTGSTRNGVTTGGFGQFGGAYSISGLEQITLSQWQEKNGSLEEFRRLDLNGDGIITSREREIALRRKSAQQEQK